MHPWSQKPGLPPAIEIISPFLLQVEVTREFHKLSFLLFEPLLWGFCYCSQYGLKVDVCFKWFHITFTSSDRMALKKVIRKRFSHSNGKKHELLGCTFKSLLKGFFPRHAYNTVTITWSVLRLVKAGAKKQHFTAVFTGELPLKTFYILHWLQT